MSRGKRMHLTKEGRPKIGYPDRNTAGEAALRMEIQRGLAFSHYECIICRLWHIGRMPTRLRSSHTRYIDFVELGPRAAFNVLAENLGNDETRYARLIRRARRCRTIDTDA